MAYKRQNDRTLCIRLTKALQRCATHLPTTPPWALILPNGEEGKLPLPSKDERLTAHSSALWLKVARMALADMIQLKQEDCIVEITTQLDAWANKTQGPRADGK